MTTKPRISEAELREMFDGNFERLRLENGHSLAPHVREAAWDQVRLYWRKLRPVAESVTETEVKLSLPNQHTPSGREFCLEGIVDIVREDDKVTMYDLKTHDLEFVRSHIDMYREQLNVYAYIWRNLRGERLDETAIICTPLPEILTAALQTGDVRRIETALAEWEPVVPIEFDSKNVQNTIAEFARAVDQIEDGEFRPPSVNTLTKREEGQSTFATRVCVNCDLRFSCSSFRNYARKYRPRNWQKFGDIYDFEVDEGDALARFAANSEEGERAFALGE